MPTLDVAHVQEQGVSLIITPVSSSFGRMTQQQQQDAADSIQFHATAAGLSGSVVPVWRAGGGRMGFFAPRAWAPFFRSISLSNVHANINRRIAYN